MRPRLRLTGALMGPRGRERRGLLVYSVVPSGRVKVSAIACGCGRPLGALCRLNDSPAGQGPRSRLTSGRSWMKTLPSDRLEFEALAHGGDDRTRTRDQRLNGAQLK